MRRRRADSTPRGHASEQEFDEFEVFYGVDVEGAKPGHDIGDDIAAEKKRVGFEKPIHFGEIDRPIQIVVLAQILAASGTILGSEEADHRKVWGKGIDPLERATHFPYRDDAVCALPFQKAEGFPQIFSGAQG